MMNKKDIRKDILSIRDSLSDSQREALNNKIFDKVINSSEYKCAKCIFVFVSYRSEVNTHGIIKHALSSGKIVCVPKIISKDEGMKAVRIEKFSELVPGAFNILEPISTYKKIDETFIDLTYVPGVAFDRHGGRVGYGGGYYDRFLKKLKKDSEKIAICYNFQLLDEVPRENHDVSIYKIITD
ncbi:5-formyltetrahydrofolate cyclo-ligase [Clostridium tyrobutyricum]|uniref:5-formyltetrahydrofolate cyclo-ligase n=1 Tax=Clostridium tyrobutyricum TaxID=1519 RepID=UPI001C391207|nr:5-formyltetrahydrofolate cyclo-ligase [Clostridium tyrobutyricum]MBV4440972.1 5-formyltetrahydrofolate cyclo-ligase [Clostridium tyrobutyricum]